LRSSRRTAPSRAARAVAGPREPQSRKLDALAPAHSGDERLLWLAWGVFAALTVFAYRYVLAIGFGNDDYLILDRVAIQRMGLDALHSPLIAGYWRPWSRELHFWLLARVFGMDSAAFHAANLLLWLAVLVSLLLLFRRLTDTRTAALAVGAAFATSAWGILLVWACCSQDLWMLLFGTLYLHALISERRIWAMAALAMALLSKETAALLLPLAVWMQFTRFGWGALRPRVWAGSLLVVAAWVLAHPSLLAAGAAARFAPAVSDPRLSPPLAHLLAPFNLEVIPRASEVGRAGLIEAAIWAVALGALAWAALRPGSEPGSEPQAGTRLRLGLGWWAIAWSPFVISPHTWHSYYGVFGICAAWLVIATLLRRHAAVLALLVAAVAALRPMAARTYQPDWGTETFERRACERSERIRRQMLALYPRLPAQGRVFIAGVPSGSGLLTAPRYSCAMHVWYRDGSVVLAGLSQFWTRPPDAPGGPDRFCVLDRALRLMPLADGAPSAPDSLRENPVWPVTEENVGALLSDAGEHGRAIAVFSRLAALYPDTARYAYDLGVIYDTHGDAERAGHWLDRADSVAGAPPSRGRGFRARAGLPSRGSGER